MKLFATIILSLVILPAISFSKTDFEAYQVYTSKGKSVSFDKLIKESEEKSYIFFGEYHNNPIAHWLQFELTRNLFLKHKKNLILGAEMFESDNQYIIDEYLNGHISEKNFQDEVRLWPNYNTDYKPLVEFAKQNNLAFIATNIPRRYANMVYKKGIASLEPLSSIAKSYIVPLEKFQFDSTVACYKNLMGGMGGHGGINMATSQAIKDATMAHFILKNVKLNTVFLHVNGAYHSDNQQGIIHYLKAHVELENILTISIVEQEDVAKLEDSNHGIADFIICVPEVMTKTH
jgi:uncharacterized iron-regulated protein